MRRQAFARFSALAGILLLASGLVAFSLTSVRADALRGKALYAGAVGIISFLGLCTVARVCGGMTDPPQNREFSPARQSLYAALQEAGLPIDQPHTSRG